MELNVNDIVILKKKHPCGSFEWEILRTGADIKLRCMGCSHQIMLTRSAAIKSIKSVKAL